mgnify:FL=1|jgi:hypothetical protein
MLNERKLTSGEKSKLKKLEGKVPMKPFKDQYGDEGESVYYATLTKMAKENVTDPYDRLVAIMEAMKALPDKRSEDEILKDRVNMMAKQIGLDPNTESMMRVGTHGKPGSVAKRLANQIVVGKVKQALRRKGVK